MSQDASAERAVNDGIHSLIGALDRGDVGAAGDIADRLHIEWDRFRGSLRSSSGSVRFSDLVCEVFEEANGKAEPGEDDA